MGGKGRKRREKNYIAAHGSHRERLPPPPEISQLDAIPSKLKKLISLSSSNFTGVKESSEESSRKRKRKPDHQRSENAIESIDSVEGTAAAADENPDGKKNKRKNKRLEVEDRRFENEAPSQSRQKRRERKKMYLEEKKRKKQKKASAGEEADFPGRERIQFGDVVQAPPKLIAVPKASLGGHDAYKERLRLQAIESYRTRKGWTDRPGLKLPSLDLLPSF